MNCQPSPTKNREPQVEIGKTYQWNGGENSFHWETTWLVITVIFLGWIFLPPNKVYAQIPGVEGPRAESGYYKRKNQKQKPAIQLEQNKKPAEAVTKKQPSPKPADFFISTALRLRTQAVLDPEMTASYYAQMPRTAIGEDPQFQAMRPLLWSLFFRNSIVKLGHLTSEAPVAGYYNPLLDIFVLTRWERQTPRRYSLHSIRALPGDQFGGNLSSNGDLTGPPWLREEGANVFPALRTITQRRLDEFDENFPLQKATASPIELVSSDMEKGSQLAAEERMFVFFYQQHEQNSEGLRQMTRELQKAFTSGNLQQVKHVVSTVDQNVENYLRAFSGNGWAKLEHDVTFPTHVGGALAFFSNPHNGNIYLIADYQKAEPQGYSIHRLAILDLTRRPTTDSMKGAS